MDDLLYQSALAYRALMAYRYTFTLGFKGKLYTLCLAFPRQAYHHLAGLHKTGIAQLRNKNKALDLILSRQITARQLGASGVLLEDRWKGICRLQHMLEQNEAVFRYRGHEHPGSIIQADYLISDNETLFFINGESPASIFGQKRQGYEIGCPCMKVLMIEREAVDTGESTILFRSKNYKA